MATAEEISALKRRIGQSLLEREILAGTATFAEIATAIQASDAAVKVQIAAAYRDQDAQTLGQVIISTVNQHYIANKVKAAVDALFADDSLTIDEVVRIVRALGISIP